MDISLKQRLVVLLVSTGFSVGVRYDASGQRSIANEV